MLKINDCRKYFIPISECVEDKLNEYEPFFEKEAEFLNAKGIGCVMIKTSKFKDKRLIYILLREEEKGGENCQTVDYLPIPMKRHFRKFKLEYDKPECEIIRAWEVR